MPTIEQLLDWARDLIAAYSPVVRFLCVRLEECAQNDELMETAGELFVATGQTTESIMLLIEHGLIGDATALFRSLLEGTARFCHLLSAPSSEEEQNRLHEFEEVLGDFEMAKLSKWVSALKNGALYKTTKRMRISDA